MSKRHPRLGVDWAVLMIVPVCAFACYLLFLHPSVLVEEYGGKRLVTPFECVGYWLLKVGDPVVHHFGLLIAVGGIVFIVAIWVLLRSLDRESIRRWEAMSPEEHRSWRDALDEARTRKKERRRKEHGPGVRRRPEGSAWWYGDIQND
jgi:hypothetical protein